MKHFSLLWIVKNLGYDKWTRNKAPGIRRQERFLLWLFLRSKSPFHLRAVIPCGGIGDLRKKAKGQSSICQQCFKWDSSEWNRSEWNCVLSDRIASVSREFPRERRHSWRADRNSRRRAMLKWNWMAYAFIVLSDVSHPSRENFPGDENSNGSPREISGGEQCSSSNQVKQRRWAPTASAFARGKSSGRSAGKRRQPDRCVYTNVSQERRNLSELCL